MNDSKTSPYWKRAIAWVVVSLVSILFGSFVTHIGDRYINPLWSAAIRFVLGTHCCFKARDPIPVGVFVKQMGNLIKGDYVISVSPNAAKAWIAAGNYECKKAYLEVMKEVLDRNSGNLRYRVDAPKKVIHITRTPHH